MPSPLHNDSFSSAESEILAGASQLVHCTSSLPFFTVTNLMSGAAGRITADAFVHPFITGYLEMELEPEPGASNENNAYEYTFTYRHKG